MVDVFDASRLANAVAAARPEVVISSPTAGPGEPGVSNFLDDGGAVSNAKARAALGREPGLR